MDGIHEVPPKVKELWLECQEVRKQKAKQSPRPDLRNQDRSYPFSNVLKCDGCGSLYHGEAVQGRRGAQLRLVHDRRDTARACQVKPKSQSVNELVDQFGQRVVSCMHLDSRWNEWILAALRNDRPRQPEDEEQASRIKNALENLRKQHLWGDIDDESYRRERVNLEGQLRLVAPAPINVKTPNLERAAKLLEDLESLWFHPGVDDSQREELLQEVFQGVTIEGRHLISVEPKAPYVPLFATMVVSQEYGSQELYSS